MKRKKIRLILTVLIGMNLAFIWGNSAMTGEQSGDMSGSILAIVAGIFPVFAGENGHFLLRKLAHFSEFACLGLLTGARKLAGGEKLRLSLSGFGLAVACIDETIQLYVPTRASSLIDVWIDTAGFFTGSMVLLLGHKIYIRYKQRKSKSGGL